MNNEVKDIIKKYAERITNRRLNEFKLIDNDIKELIEESLNIKADDYEMDERYFKYLKDNLFKEFKRAGDMNKEIAYNYLSRNVIDGIKTLLNHYKKEN